MTQEHDHYSREQLLQYLNIELLVEDMRVIEDHVVKCASCMRLLKEIEPESNKNERDKLFNHTTEIIQVVQRKEKDSKRLRLRIYLTAIVLVVAGIAWAVYVFNIFPKISHEARSSREDGDMQTVSPLIDNSEAFIDTTFMTSIIDVSEATLESKNNKAGSLEEKIVNTLPIQLNESPVQNSINNEGLANSIQNAEVLISEPKNEEPKQEAPVVERNGTIELVASSVNQAMPEVGYVNYNRYIKNEYKYPTEAINTNLQGEVIVQFIVAVDGNIADLKIVSGLSAACDDLVKNIILNGPKWKPFVGDDFVEYRSATLKFTFRIYQ